MPHDQEMTVPDRPFRDEPTEILHAALHLADTHAKQAARFNPAHESPLPTVTALFRTELQHRGEL